MWTNSNNLPADSVDNLFDQEGEDKIIDDTVIVNMSGYKAETLKQSYVNKPTRVRKKPDLLPVKKRRRTRASNKAREEIENRFVD